MNHESFRCSVCGNILDVHVKTDAGHDVRDVYIKYQVEPCKVCLARAENEGVFKGLDRCQYLYHGPAPFKPGEITC